jgi:putative Holliday junction resolvase
MRILALDPGTARLGLALSDSEGRLALPLEILSRDPAAAWLARLGQIIAERRVELLVVGMPLTLAGEHGPAAQQAEVLVEELRAALPIPVVTWDERLSSAQVERQMQAAGLSSRARRGAVDAAAAAVFLQSYLDAHGNEPSVPQ